MLNNVPALLIPRNLIMFTNFTNLFMVLSKLLEHDCRRPGNRGPQACLPAARGVAKLAGRTTHLHQQGIQDPREGPSLVRGATQDLLWSGLARQAHEERRYQGEANLTRGQAQPRSTDTRRAPARTSSLFPLWCKGGKRSHRVPRPQAKVAISV